jgi:endonuclease/exonuclease/phosphatase family metal-dependent hydrolase
MLDFLASLALAYAFIQTGLFVVRHFQGLRLVVDEVESKEHISILSLNAEGVVSAEDIKGIVDIIEAAGMPNVVALQETRPEDSKETDQSFMVPLLKELHARSGIKWHCFEQNLARTHPAVFSNAVISQFPIKSITKDGFGVLLDTPAGIPNVYVFSIHLPDEPYQPYQLMNITYGKCVKACVIENGQCIKRCFLDSAEDAVEQAHIGRGRGVKAILDSVAEANKVKDACVIVAGDFNEPSARDWTARAQTMGIHPYVVNYPSIRTLEKNGFVDTFRSVFPDEVLFPGNTFTTKPQLTEKHDRIDFVLSKPASDHSMHVLSSQVVGENSKNAHVVVPNRYVSDHRGVLSKIRFVKQPLMRLMRSL